MEKKFKHARRDVPPTEHDIDLVKRWNELRVKEDLTGNEIVAKLKVAVGTMCKARVRCAAAGIPVELSKKKGSVDKLILQLLNKKKAPSTEKHMHNKRQHALPTTVIVNETAAPSDKIMVFSMTMTPAQAVEFFNNTIMR